MMLGRLYFLVSNDYLGLREAPGNLSVNKYKFRYTRKLKRKAGKKPFLIVRHINVRKIRSTNK